MMRFIKLFTLSSILILTACSKTVEDIVIPEKIEKVPEILELISFGSWKEDSIQTSPAKIITSQDITITSKLSGTIKNVYVSLGDSVKKGQVLATFDKNLDPVQVQYENALRNYNVQKTVANNTVKSSENSLKNTEKNYDRIQIQEYENAQSLLEKLQTQYLLSQNNLINTLDFLDQQTGASGKFLPENYPSQNFVGAKNRILKAKIEDLIRNYQKKVIELPKEVIIPRKKTGDAMRLYSQSIRKNAKNTLKFGKNIQVLISDFEVLLNSTIFSSSYTEAQHSGVPVQTQNFTAQLQSQILSLEAVIQQENLQESRTQTILQQARNQITQAEQSLSVANASASSQKQSAQNQIYQARSNQKEFRVLAPFSGKISQKMAEENMSVGQGQSLFQLTNQDEGKKVSASVPASWQEIIWKISPENSQNELDEKNHETLSTPKLTIAYSSGKSQLCTTPIITQTREARTQKVKLECPINDRDVHIGDRVTLRLTQPAIGSNMLPLSAFAFDPDQTEVLVAKKSGNYYALERKLVEIGELRGSTIPVVSGLAIGDKVVPFYYQSLPDDLVTEPQ